MAGTSFRPASGGEARYADPLPTQDAVDWVKSEAWRRVCLKALGFGWPVGEAGLGVIKLAPALAVIALSKLCPQVRQERCAACLGISWAEASELWNRALAIGPWAAEQAGEIAEMLQGEG